MKGRRRKGRRPSDALLAGSAAVVMLGAVGVGLLLRPDGTSESVPSSPVHTSESQLAKTDGSPESPSEPSAEPQPSKSSTVPVKVSQERVGDRDDGTQPGAPGGPDSSRPTDPKPSPSATSTSSKPKPPTPPAPTQPPGPTQPPTGTPTTTPPPMTSPPPSSTLRP